MMSPRTTRLASKRILLQSRTTAPRNGFLFAVGVIVALVPEGAADPVEEAGGHDRVEKGMTGGNGAYGAEQIAHVDLLEDIPRRIRHD
jgi:hypothetical protein